jgi:FtsH-binding integral membrane protein
MSPNDTSVLRRPISRVETTNAFLRSVYNWMALGLGLTALVSFALTYTSLGDVMVTPQARTLGLVAIFAELGLVFFLSLRIQKLSAGAATGLFLAYSALNGFTLSFVLLSYTASSVTQAFVIATGMFAAMSFYGMVTKRDLTALGSILIMAVFGLLIAMVVNLFFHSTTMELVISCVGVLVFLGLTAYDTQFLKEMGESVPADDALAVRRGAILGALKLYLDFINLFLMLLRLFGASRE